MLRRVIETWRDAGIEELVVVLGKDADKIREGTEDFPPTPRFVVNSNWKAGMFSSVQAGLAAASPSSTHFAISPADLPFLSKGTLRRVIDASAAVSERTVVVPTFQRRRGHPLVIPAALRPRLLSWPDTARLNLIFEEKDLSVLHLEGFDETILHDVDVPSDLSVFSK